MVGFFKFSLVIALLVSVTLPRPSLAQSDGEMIVCVATITVCDAHSGKLLERYKKGECRHELSKFCRRATTDNCFTKLTKRHGAKKNTSKVCKVRQSNKLQ